MNEELRKYFNEMMTRDRLLSAFRSLLDTHTLSSKRDFIASVRHFVIADSLSFRGTLAVQKNTIRLAFSTESTII